MVMNYIIINQELDVYYFYGLDRVYILSTKTCFSFHLILGECQSLLLKEALSSSASLPPGSQ